MNFVFVCKDLNSFFNSENLFTDCKKNFDCPFNNKHSTSEIFVQYCIQKITGYKLCDIKIEKDENGKPYASNFPKLYFNLSHSQNLIICVISKRQVGVDVEFVKDYTVSEKLISFFSNLEWEYIQSFENKAYPFYELWTLKESYLKYLGVGLRKSLKSFEIILKDRNHLIIEKGEIVPIFLQSFEFESSYRVSICSHFNKPIILNRVSKRDFEKIITQCYN